MDGLAALCIVIAIITLCHAYPQTGETAELEDRQIGIGAITGGKFGPGSFSIGLPGSSNNNQDENDGKYVVLSKTEESRPPQRVSSGGHRGHTVNAAKPNRPQSSHGQRGKEGGIGGGQIIIGTVVVPNNKKHKGHKRRNGNSKPPVRNTGTLQATSATNADNDGVPDSENEYNKGDQGGAIIVDTITGGNFGPGTFGINDEKPTGVLPNKGDASNKESSVITDPDNEALHTMGHGANSNEGAKTGDGPPNGPIKSGNGYISGSNDGEEPWVWSS